MEKKKRKLNVVDIIVILAILAAIGLVAYRYFTRPEQGIIAMDRIDFTVTVPASDASVANFAANQPSPAQMIAAGAWINAWVDSASASPINVRETETVLGGIVLHIETESEYATITFRCHADVPAGDITTTLGTQELRNGRLFIVKTLDFEVNGVITDFVRTHK